MMRTLLPLMSERRAAQINTSIESYNPKRRTKHDHTTGVEWTDRDRLATPLGHDLFWLAGLLEAEGSFLSGYPTKANQPRVQLTTTDEDVIGWAATWLGVGYTHIKPRDNSHPSYKQAYFACVSAGPAVNIMHKLYPLMGSRRHAQIERALASYDPHNHKRNTSKLTDEQVLRIYERAQSGEQQKVIAAEYNIDRSTIADIKRGKSWSWLTGNKPLGSRSFLPPKV